MARQPCAESDGRRRSVNEKQRPADGRRSLPSTRLRFCLPRLFGCLQFPIHGGGDAVLSALWRGCATRRPKQAMGQALELAEDDLQCERQEEAPPAMLGQVCLVARYTWEVEPAEREKGGASRGD